MTETIKPESHGLRGVRCPHCGAAPGDRCISPRGWPMTDIHVLRADAYLQSTGGGDCPRTPHKAIDCPSEDEHTQPERMADYLELIRETLEPYQATTAPTDAVRAALQLVRQALAVEEREAFYGAQKAAQDRSLPQFVTWYEVQNTVDCPKCGAPERTPCDTISRYSVHEARITAYKEYKEEIR